MSPNSDDISVTSLDSGTSSVIDAGSGPPPLPVDTPTSKAEPVTPENALSLKGATTNTAARSRVSMKNRRGLFPHLSLIPEYEDARNYPPKIKNCIVFVVAFAAICGPMGTSIMLPAISDIARDLDTSESVVNVSVGIYLLSIGIFPLWWSAFSETYGRRSIYIISFSLFVGFCIGCALAPSIGLLILFRVLSGGCSASVQAVGAGTIADLYLQHERGRAMGWYYLGPLMGPFLAPILGGVVAEVWGWRATFWLMTIFAGVAIILIAVALPETLRRQDNLAAIKDLMAKAAQEEAETDSTNEKDYSSTDKKEKNTDGTLLHMIQSHRSARDTIASFNMENVEEQAIGEFIMPSLARLPTNRSEYSHQVAVKALEHEISKTLTMMEEESRWKRFKARSYEFFLRPLHSLILLSYIPVLLVISYSAVCFAVIYFFNMSITYEYSRPPYNFSSIIVGLLYIPNSVSYVLASIIGGRWNDHLIQKYTATHTGPPKPESRISWNVVTAVILFPPACLIYGWTIKFKVHWVVPLIGTAIFGFASMLVIGATVTYLVDTLPGKGATGVALNNLIRQILAAIATFVVEPLIKALGAGVLFTILMAIMTCASVSLLILKLKGDKLRKDFNLGSLYDKL